ncbi:MAG: hypothetical protein NXI30_23605 [bacterium]|nr:hypothetical protein [bacterium]
MIHTSPRYVTPTAAQLARLEAFREAHAADEIGTIADRILFEDDRVRIWEMRLEPGESSALHRHEHDYYLAIFSGDLIAGVFPEGAGDPVVVELPAEGNTVAVPKGGLEWAVNIGTRPYREVLVELKGT